MFSTIYACLLLLYLQVSNGAKRIEVHQESHHVLNKRSIGGSQGGINTDHTAVKVDLGRGEHLHFKSLMNKPSGRQKLKLVETYKGLPVVGEAVVLEVDKNGEKIGRVKGHLVEGIEEDLPSVSPSISANEALECALSYRGHLRTEVTFDEKNDVDLVVFVEGLNEDVTPMLAYRLSYRIERPGKISRPSFFIDAVNCTVLKTWDSLSFVNPTVDNGNETVQNNYNVVPQFILVNGEGGNLKTGKKLYDGDHLPQLRVTQLSNTTCSLKNSYAVVYDCQGDYDCPKGMVPHEFDCESENPDFINGAYSPLNDVLFHVSVTFEMYEEWYGMTNIVSSKGVDGSRCIARVHYGRNLETAFWDGQYVTVGDGGRTFYPLTALDIIAHEMSHGFTEQNSGLYYEDETGAINEAFSDMAGEAAEDYLQRKVDWEVGREITKTEGNSMRFFKDPHDDGRSISHVDEFCFNMDPHMGSGLFNKVFYVLSHTGGWNVRNAFHVFLVANQLYWGPDSGFQQAACDALQAAEDLELNVTDVQQAFESVGIIPCGEKDPRLLVNPITMDGKNPVSYEVYSDVSSTLRYTDLVFYMFGNTPLSLTVSGPGYRYSVQPENSIYSFIDNNAITVHTFTQCHRYKCTATIQTFRPGKVILMPLAYLSNLLSEGYIRHSGQRLQLEFEIPEDVLESGHRVAFTVEMVGTDMSVYLRHLSPPVTETAEFELAGHNKLPMLLCSPKRGTYHMHIVANSGSLHNINVQMFALLEAIKVT